MATVQQALQRLSSRWETYLEDLKQLVRIPSVSFPGFPKAEVQRSAAQVERLLEQCGLEHVQQLHIGDAHPYVYGDWLHASRAPTVLLYAHHDVQPPLRQELWHTPPFEPTTRDGRLYGRGSADDKAGVVVHTASIDAYLHSVGRLPVNVKVIIEGEEEIGSAHLSEFLARHRELLRSDTMVLTDLGNLDTGIPSLTTSLRGLVALEVEVRALAHPLHSGAWGGPLPDPIMALSKMLAALVDDQGRITIPGFYDAVRPLRPEELTALQALPMDEALFRAQSSLVPGGQLIGGDHHVLEKLWRQPSLVVTSIQSGGRGTAGNVLMDSAWARVTVRIVPDMDAQQVTRQLTAALQSLVPWGLEMTITPQPAGNAWLTDSTHPVFAAAQRALAQGYGTAPVLIGCGGSIPFVDPLSQALGGIPALLVGVEDPYSNAHGENESLHLGDFRKAIASQVYLFAELAELGKWPGPHVQ